MSNGKNSFGGGGKMPDLGALMKQAQKLQADVQKAQEELAELTVDGAAGGGLVTATVNGQHDVVKIKIDAQVVDPSDIGMLEDLVTAAINQANTKMREISKERMSKMMGGMPGLPGLF
jgi:nucleoid-associated protein EbfC